MSVVERHLESEVERQHAVVACATSVLKLCAPHREGNEVIQGIERKAAERLISRVADLQEASGDLAVLLRCGLLAVAAEESEDLRQLSHEVSELLALQADATKKLQEDASRGVCITTSAGVLNSAACLRLDALLSTQAALAAVVQRRRLDDNREDATSS